MPYYFYMCDMIPFGRALAGLGRRGAAAAARRSWATCPGFATPRIVCDVPFVGKRWVHQLESYDRERGISYWTKNYRTSIEADDPEALTRHLRVLRPDPHPAAEGQQWWHEHGAESTTVPASHGVHA